MSHSRVGNLEKLPIDQRTPCPHSRTSSPEATQLDWAVSQSESLTRREAPPTAGLTTQHQTERVRELHIRPMPIEKLIPYARNARTHSDAQVAQIAASIREFGWTNPILIRPNGVLLAGHARLLAARQLGLREVPDRTERTERSAMSGPRHRR